MIYKLLEAKHPLLHTKLPEFVDDDEFNRKEFSQSMIETMNHWGGIGLSANQVGFNYRMFVMGYGDNYVSCWNPQILNESVVTVPIKEGCLTYPGFYVLIHRPEDIYVQYEDDDKVIHKNNYYELLCRVFQHELDHMDGIDFLKRASRMQLDIAKRKWKKSKRKFEKIHGKK